MNRLNKTESAVFLYCRFSISDGSVFPDYLQKIPLVLKRLIEPVKQLFIIFTGRSYIAHNNPHVTTFKTSTMIASDGI